MHILIIGGGIIGLGIGWQLAKAGYQVEIYDKNQAGRGASWAAAGMLSPWAEAHMMERELLQLGCLSAQMYPDWIKELENDGGLCVDYQTAGTLLVARDHDDERELRHHYETQKDLGFQVEWLSGKQARELEPFLSPRITSAILCPQDHQVDNRKMVEALIMAFQKFGGILKENAPVEKVEVEGDRVKGVWINNQLKTADIFILSAGCWSSNIKGLPREVKPPVRPLKGQILAVRMEPDVKLEKVVRGPDAYLVPKKDGRLIIGATSEDKGFDTHLTAGGLFDLLQGAWEIVPAIYDLPIIEMWTGLRPGSRDSAPILGKTSLENLIMATGHYRKGILLTPITAREIASLVLTGKTPETLKPFQLSRFLGKA